MRLMAVGNLKKNHFNHLLSDYDTEQQTLDVEKHTLQMKLNKFENNQLRADEFLKLVKKYFNFEELTTPMLNEFIEKVVEYEAEEFRKERYQRCRDLYQFDWYLCN